MISNPCSICLEKNCPTNGVCNCSTCKNADTCPKFLSPTLRITTKCTQKCQHCCFSCSPEKTEMMTVEMAEKVAEFYKNNNIQTTQIMGGECVCNPNWKQILQLILPLVLRARIVSNGDWVKTCPEFAEFLSKYPQVHLAISNDQWHTNANIKAAARKCKKLGIDHKICKEGDLKEEGIVPVGRGEFWYGPYSSFSCYCHNPIHKYAFLIVENGTIYKCSFGMWNYANVQEYTEGGFAERFKEFNKKFYSIFIANCTQCHRAFETSKRKKEKLS